MRATKKVAYGSAVEEVERQTRRARKGPRTAGERRQQRLLEGVKRRALARLRDLHPQEYMTLLAIERRNAGLDPVPPQWDYETMRPGGVYHPRDGSGDTGAEEDARSRS